MRNDSSRFITIQRSRKSGEWQNVRVFFDMIRTIETATVVIGQTEVYCNRKGALLYIY